MPYRLGGLIGYPYGPAARFNLTGVQPPATGYLGPSDQLSISVTSPNAAINFDIALRYLDLNGNVQPLLTKVMAPATGSTPFVKPIQLAEGFLLSAVAFNATVERGQCWVQFVILRQNADTTVVVADVLLQGYVAKTDYVAWPGTAIDSSIAGPGFIRQIIVPAPGVGNDVVLTVPPGTRWRLKFIQTFLTNPSDQIVPLLQIQNGPVTIAWLPATDEMAATDAFQLTWLEGTSETPFNSTFSGGPLGLQAIVKAGWNLRLTDSTFPFPGPPSAFAFFSDTSFIVEEWVEL